MVLTKYFSLFGLSVSLLRNIFIFNCGCSNGSNNLNLHLETAFFKKIYSMQKSQNIQSLSPSHCGPLRDTKTNKFLSHSFSRCNYEKLIRTLQNYTK